VKPEAGPAVLINTNASSPRSLIPAYWGIKDLEGRHWGIKNIQPAVGIEFELNALMAWLLSVLITREQPTGLDPNAEAAAIDFPVQFSAGKGKGKGVLQSAPFESHK